MDEIEAWNQEPKDPTNHALYGGHKRGIFGCSISQNNLLNDASDYLASFKVYI